jgi:hypothetical protein
MSKGAVRIAISTAKRSCIFREKLREMKPRSRKARKREAGRLRQRQAQEQALVSVFKRIGRFVIAILTGIATLYGVADFNYYATTPSVLPPPADPEAALNSPFQVTNNSHLFTMYNVTGACVFHEIRTPAGGGLENLGLAVPWAGNIRPGAYALWKCPVGIKPVVRLEMYIELRYQLRPLRWFFSWKRTYNSPEMTWWFDSSGKPHWEIGDLLNPQNLDH